MKKIFLTAFAIVLCAVSVEAQEVVDTLAVDCKDCDSGVKTVVKTVVTTESSEVSQTGDHHLLDFDIPFYCKVKKSRKPSFWLDRPNLGVALLQARSSDPYDFDIQNSYEIFVNVELDSWRLSRRSSLALGLGVDWKNFVMTGRNSIVKGETGEILLTPYPEKSDPRSSKLRLASVAMPLTYSCAFGQGYGFTLGPVLNVNAYSSIVNKYSLDGEKQKDKYKKVHCNTFTVDLMFQLNIKDITLFVKYCPVPLMDKSYWPEWQYASAGIALSWW